MVNDNPEQTNIRYANVSALDDLIHQAVESVETGSPLEVLTEMIKTAPTHILAASATHNEERYRPGSTLVTYNGIDADGKLIQETWNGGVASIAADSVILKSDEPIKYPTGHALAGEVVKGTYAKDGTFTVDQENGKTILCNEYVSDTTFVKGAYGIDATATWQTGYKMVPSYTLEIPKEVGKVTITSSSGRDIHLAGGDYVVLDTKKGKVSSVHACEQGWLERTYMPMETYRAGLAK